MGSVNLYKFFTKIFIYKNATLLGCGFNVLGISLSSAVLFQAYLQNVYQVKSIELDKSGLNIRITLGAFNFKVLHDMKKEGEVYEFPISQCHFQKENKNKNTNNQVVRIRCEGKLFLCDYKALVSDW